MKFILQTFLFIGLLFIFCFCIEAQTSNISNKEPEITSKYNAEKDETVMELGQIKMSSNNTKEAYLSVTATFKDKNLTNRPEDLVFIIQTLSTDDYKYSPINRMKIIAENSKLPDIIMLNLDKRKINADFLETLGTRMKSNIFKQFSNYKSVKLELDKTIFQISENDMIKIRDFDKQITP